MKQKNKTKAERIASIPMEQVMRLSGKEGRKTLEQYVKTLKFGYKRRVQSFSPKMPASPKTAGPRSPSP